MNDLINKTLNWEFLGEPATRWFLFLGVLIALTTMWRIILGYIAR